MLEPLLPKSNNRCGRWRNHRQVINGIIHRLSTGCQWCQLPARFGPWQTIHKRHSRWSADGTWERLLQHAQAIADAGGDIDWNINVESTSVRATSTPPALRPIRHQYLRLPQKGPCQDQCTCAHRRLILAEAARQAKHSAVPAAA
ncbi:transposase [Streptomyces sp. NPDC101181]|uniref:transposase n=1 Tax=Streptomyces sp. NPDC101181 TaxID=3366125 RepID=UPI0037FC8C69